MVSKQSQIGEGGGGYQCQQSQERQIAAGPSYESTFRRPERSESGQEDADGEPKRGFFDWLRSLYSCYLGFVLRRAFDSEDDDLVEANPFTVWRSPAHLSSLVLFLRLLQL